MASRFWNSLPFTAARTSAKSKKAEALLNDTSTVSKLVKIAGLAVGMGTSTYTNSRATFEMPPYDFPRIIKAIDTDSFLKQGFNKYKELLWKEGWEIIGENTDAVDYLKMRIDLMELVMRRPFQELLTDLGDQLVKFSNAFVVKARGDIAHLSSVPIQPLGNNLPIAGYYLLSAETVEIMRDMHNTVLQYRQRLDATSGYVSSPNSQLPTWDADEIIHFYHDRKPGRAFGTPFVVAGIDDVVAFRQIEEDVQNLIHRELFPLYKYKVGTEDHPTEPGEIEAAAVELANLRTEGGLILPDRHDVDVIGAANTALDASFYLTHFRQRVTIMLGLAEHHLGISGQKGGNRSVTDRLDIALYDKVKHYQRYMADMIRLLIFNELLYEGGFDPLNNPHDRCGFRFREIDVETQIKRENHTIQKWVNNIIDQEEVRIELGEDAEVDESALFLALQARMTPNSGTTIKSGANGTTTAVSVDSTPAAALPAGNGPSDKKAPAKAGMSNVPNAAKGVGNKSRPQNQHGTRTGPIVRHSDDEFDWLIEAVDLIDGDDIIEAEVISDLEE